MNPALFTQVDQYFNQLFSLEDEVLIETRTSIVEHGMPEHSVSPNQGQLLFFLAKLCNAKLVIEIGSLAGYSTIWLGRALPEGGKLISIEIDPHYAEVARRNIAKADLSEKVEIITGDALAVLSQIEQVASTPVDLLFMDADKPNYTNYFAWGLRMARTGSLIIADNVIREGKIIDPNNTEEKVIGVRQYCEMLASDTQVTSVILPTVGEKEYDGMALAMVK